MRKHRLDRRQRKKRKTIIFSMIGIVFLFSVGYATFSQNFLVSGKGIIVELDDGVLTPNKLKKLVVSTGDGIYKDAYEDGRYIYRGSEPNNYITFNSEMWRIISVESDGTLKIIRNESIGNISFDPGYWTSILGITDKGSTEGTRYSNVQTDYCYYNNGTETEYWGCNVWGSKSTMLDSSESNITKMPREVTEGVQFDLPETEAYLNTYLNGIWYSTLSEEYKSMVDTHIWNVGMIENSTGQTLGTNIEQESSYKWRGKAGLMNTTDYIRTSINPTCANVNEYNNAENCYQNSKTHNWLFDNNYQWTLSSYSYLKTLNVWNVYPSGSMYNHGADNLDNVRPVLYLNANIKLTGKGTQEKPYSLSLE